jgi:hypothetical protein
VPAGAELLAPWYMTFGKTDPSTLEYNPLNWLNKKSQIQLKMVLPNNRFERDAAKNAAPLKRNVTSPTKL